MNNVLPETVAGDRKQRDRGLYRDLVAYWIFGLCNNYGYVVMLSAAHDIISQFEHMPSSIAHESVQAVPKEMKCQIISTGAILLADILPSLFVKLIIPFLPFWPRLRINFAILLAAAGFVLVAYAHTPWVAILGVALTSASSGIGETTFMAYSESFNHNVISTWSSGTGGAGVIGSSSYATLSALNVSPRNTMLIMLTFPAIEALSFWFLLRRPNKNLRDEQEKVIAAEENALVSIQDKLLYIRKLWTYMLPLALVYFFEYFINQGLFELIYINDHVMDKKSQYRWLNVNYQIGVFISRSSVNIYHFKHIWIMSVLQFINVIFFFSETLFPFTPSIWIIFVIVIWEGLLGGAAYVNTFYRMSREIAAGKKRFAMSMVVQSDAFGIALAGFLAIPVHNAICGMPSRQ